MSFEIKIDSLQIPMQKVFVLIRDTQDKYQEVYGTDDGFSMAISDSSRWPSICWCIAIMGRIEIKYKRRVIILPK